MYKKLFIILISFLFMAGHCDAQCIATVTASGPTTFCQGDSVMLTSSSALSYQWYVNGTIIPGATDSSYEATISGNYAVVDSFAGPCTAFSNITIVTVDPLPVAILTGPSTFCSNSFLGLCASTCLGCTYQWKHNSVSIITATTACYTPASSGNYSCTVTDANGCSATSAAISAIVYTPPAVAITANPSSGMYCSGPGVLLSDNIPCSGCTYEWFLNGVAIAGLTSSSYLAIAPGIYQLTATNSNACDSSASFTVLACDSLFPGDVNYDLIVDNTDALDLALGYGSTGTSRAGATIFWIPQYCANWGTDIVPGVDMKNADCDGNGTVDANDTAAIAANYGLTHPKGAHHALPKITGLPNLYFDLTGINLIAGTTISVPIKFGTASLPMNNILGIAAHVKVSGIAPAGPTGISYPISWLGSSSNTFSFRKAINNNEVDWAYARKDHQNTSGSGTFANFTFTIPPNTSTQQMTLYFEDVKIINNQGLVVTGYNVLDDTASISPSGVNNVNTQNEYYNIVPNPSGSQCELQMFLAQQTNIQVRVLDILGKEVWMYTQENAQGNTNITLPAPAITSGIYMIQVTTGNKPPYIMKWIKN